MSLHAPLPAQLFCLITILLKFLYFGRLEPAFEFAGGLACFTCSTPGAIILHPRQDRTAQNLLCKDPLARFLLVLLLFLPQFYTNQKPFLK